ETAARGRRIARPGRARRPRPDHDPGRLAGRVQGPRPRNPPRSDRLGTGLAEGTRLRNAGWELGVYRYTQRPNGPRGWRMKGERAVRLIVRTPPVRSRPAVFPDGLSARYIYGNAVRM